MDLRFEEIETDSTVDNTIDQMDTSDPEIHFRTQARGIDAGQLVNFWREILGPWLWDPGLMWTHARPLPPTLLSRRFSLLAQRQPCSYPAQCSC